VQAPAASFIIACYNDLLLLDRQRQRRKTGILILDYGRIEAIIVLPMPCISSSSECLFSKTRRLTKWIMTRPSAPEGLVAICHGQSPIFRPRTCGFEHGWPRSLMLARQQSSSVVAKALSRDRYSTATARKGDKPRFQKPQIRGRTWGRSLSPTATSSTMGTTDKDSGRFQRAISSQSGLTASYQPDRQGRFLMGARGYKIAYPRRSSSGPRAGSGCSSRPRRRHLDGKWPELDGVRPSPGLI
jgi:hypothetical protein